MGVLCGRFNRQAIAVEIPSYVSRTPDIQSHGVMGTSITPFLFGNGQMSFRSQGPAGMSVAAAVKRGGSGAAEERGSLPTRGDPVCWHHTLGDG